MFLFIRNTEVFSVTKKIPFALRCAAKFPAARAFQNIAFAMIVISSLGIIVAAFVFRYEFEMRNYLSDVDPLGSLVRILLWIALLILSIVGINVLGKLEVHQENILKGYYRKFYVSAKHDSYEVAFTPAVRDLIADTTSDAYRAVVQVMADPAVIAIDTFNLHMDVSLVDEGEAYEGEFKLINKFEQILAPFGAEFSDALHQKREELKLEFDDVMEENQALINKFVKNVEKLTTQS